MFDAAIERLGAVLDTTPVTYTQEGVAETIKVCLGSAAKDVEREQRVSNIDKRADILFSVAAFEAAFGAGRRPKTDDVVTLHDRSWRVKPLMSGGPSWRYSDQLRLRVRVHLLEVA